MKAAYAQRGTALDDYYAAMLDPERQRKAERRAVLSGLATPGGIARSGIAAGANLAEVRDMPIEAPPRAGRRNVWPYQRAGRCC